MQVIADHISSGGMKCWGQKPNWRRFEGVRGRELGVLNFSFKECNCKKESRHRVTSRRGMKLKEILFLILEIYYSLCAPGQVWRKGTITGQSCINEQGWDLVTRGSIDLR